MNVLRNYRELIKLPTFKERYDYLRLGGVVGKDTFGFDRYLNQALYSSGEWKRFRNKIIIHHIVPLLVKDLKERSAAIFDEDNVVCVSFNTHEAIHFGDESLLPAEFKERRPNDTCPWK